MTIQSWQSMVGWLRSRLRGGPAGTPGTPPPPAACFVSEPCSFNPPEQKGCPSDLYFISPSGETLYLCSLCTKVHKIFQTCITGTRASFLQKTLRFFFPSKPLNPPKSGTQKAKLAPQQRNVVIVSDGRMAGKASLMKSQLEQRFPNCVVVERSGRFWIFPRPAMADSSPAGVPGSQPRSLPPKPEPGNSAAPGSAAEAPVAGYYSLPLTDQMDTPIGWVVIGNNQSAEAMAPVLSCWTGIRWKPSRGKP